MVGFVGLNGFNVTMSAHDDEARAGNNAVTCQDALVRHRICLSAPSALGLAQLVETWSVT